MLFHREHLAFETVFAHGEDSLFHFVEQIVYLVLFLVSAANALGGGGNDFQQDVLVANDVEVVADVRGGRNKDAARTVRAVGARVKDARLKGSRSSGDSHAAGGARAF